MSEDEKAIFTAVATIIITGIAATLVLLLAGCAHNSEVVSIGKRAAVGIDPQNATLNASYVDGLNIIDVSRENSEWEVQVDADAGVKYDAATGTITGVQRLRRKVGPQVTGYLVDLAKADPQIVVKYFEACKAYWDGEKQVVK